MEKDSVAPPLSPFIIDRERNRFSNGLVAFQVDPVSGAISSLQSEKTHREIVRSGDDGNLGLNDYLYIIGRNASKNRSRFRGEVRMEIEENGPLRFCVLVTSEAPNCNVLQRRYRLYAGEEWIEIENRFDKIRQENQEATLFGFPFNVDQGVWHVDTPWVPWQVEKEQLIGANRDYAVVQRMCNLSSSEVNVDWVTLDAPLIQFAPLTFLERGEWSHHWRTHFDPGATLYNWVCNNHWRTNYKAYQSGNLYCRYRVRANEGPYHSAASQRFARECFQPILALSGSEPLAGRSIPYAENENIIVASVRTVVTKSGGRPAVALRLHNTTAKRQETKLVILNNGTLYLSNPWDDRLTPLPETITLEPWEVLLVIRD